MKSFKISALMILFVSSVALISGCQRNNDNPILLRRTGRKDPAFEYVSSNWSKNPYNIKMDDMWLSEGISATGQNYYFFPKPAKGHKYSERFNPQSNYFQSWFGVYTIEDANNITYALSDNGIDPQAILALAIADQKGWLESFGLSQPIVAVDTSVPVNVSENQTDASSGWKITGRIHTNIDVGVDNPRLGVPSLLKAPSTAWQGLVESYGSANLDVVFYVWYAPANKELNVVYYTGVEFDDINNTHHRTLPLISEELDSMALSVTVRE
jgi:hypothetical protein